MEKDKLYIADIPKSYHYIVVSGDTIRLYNKPSARNETLTYYTLYPNISCGFYTQNSQTFGNSTTYFTDYPVSNSVWDRKDIGSILSTVFVISVFGLLLINLITSIVKRGGILGGLL